MRHSYFAIGALAALLLASGLTPVRAYDGIFSCNAKDLSVFEGDGTLRPSDDVFKKEWARVLVDTSTGMFHFPGRQPNRWQILSPKRPKHEFLATPFQLPVSVEKLPPDLFFMRDFDNGRPITFRYYSARDIITGTCERIS
jgi:hypothetical protein